MTDENTVAKRTAIQAGRTESPLSANKELADMFSAVLAPFLGQMSQLNENVSLLLGGQDESEENSADDSDRHADMDADLDAILTKDTATYKTESKMGDVLLRALAQDLTVTEKTSPPIHEALAGIFNGLLSDKMPDDKLKVKLDKYTRPENVKGLRTPKVNPLIWNQLSATMKAQDARFQKGQNTLIGSVIAMTKAADLVLQKYNQDKELITLLTDAIELALQCNHEVNHSRRVAIKKEMHEDYSALCSPSTVEGTSEFLFGDLSKPAKDILEANKLTKKVRPQPYARSRGGYGESPAYGSSQGNRGFHHTRGERPRIFLGKSRFPKQAKKKEGDTSQRQ